jgi:hypothetical protein
MLLKDLFDALNAGELRINYLGDGEPGISNYDNASKLLILARRALTALHTRFDLRIQQTWVTLVDGQDEYVLDSATYPDLLKIERILVEDSAGNLELQPFNQKQNSKSYQSPNYRSITLPVTLDTRPSRILVEYREDHPAFSEDVIYDDPATVTIELPQPFLEPLVLYIAAKAHSGNGAADGIDSATALNTQYELACQKLEAFNMDNDQLEWRDAVYEDGWV